MKTSSERIVQITQETYVLLKEKGPGRTFPNVTSEMLRHRMQRAFIKYLPNFDPRGPIRTHNFRATKATHMA